MALSLPRTCSLRRNEQGFTLPEILIVIVLMGIVLAIATSSWNSIVESREVDSATNQLASDLRQAHSSPTNRLAPQVVSWTEQQVLDNYPTLFPEALRAVFAFAAESMREVSVYALPSEKGRCDF